MGMDSVEIVLRCEEAFAITLEDSEVELIFTVGQLFELVCTKLHLPNGTAAPVNPGHSRLRGTRLFAPLPGWLRFLAPTPRPAPNASVEEQEWTCPDVWATLLALLVNQQGLRAKDIRYGAHLTLDLGID